MKEREERQRKKETLQKVEKEKWKRKESRLLAQKKLEEKWAMLRWLVKYIDENQQQWDIDKEIRQREIGGEI